MSIADDLAAATDATSTRCKVCLFLADQPFEIQAEWHAALREPGAYSGYRYSNPGVVRVLTARGLVLQDDAVRNHRRNHEQPE